MSLWGGMRLALILSGWCLELNRKETVAGRSLDFDSNDSIWKHGRILLNGRRYKEQVSLCLQRGAYGDI